MTLYLTLCNLYGQGVVHGVEQRKTTQIASQWSHVFFLTSGGSARVGATDCITVIMASSQA
eukprot:928488-Amphidinium_carterae.1